MFQQLLHGLQKKKKEVDIRVFLRMNCIKFDDPLTFHLAPSGQNISVSTTSALCAN